MASYHINQINEEMKRALSEIVREVRDPRVSSSFLTITGVDCTPDLKFAKVYYSFLSNKYTDKDVENGLKSAGGVIRSGLTRMKLRIIPELRFVRDRSAEHGAHMAELLKQVAAQPKSEDAEEQND